MKQSVIAAARRIVETANEDTLTPKSVLATTKEFFSDLGVTLKIAAVTTPGKISVDDYDAIVKKVPNKFQSPARYGTQGVQRKRLNNGKGIVVSVAPGIIAHLVPEFESLKNAGYKVNIRYKGMSRVGVPKGLSYNPEYDVAE